MSGRTKNERRDRGYANRRRASLESRHDRHSVKVQTCPGCNPSGWQPEDVAMPTRTLKGLTPIEED